MQNIEIRPANGRTDLLDIYRFRYSIYHEEMKRPQRYADHSRRLIIDPLDACATNLLALEDREIVGVVRVNFAKDISLASYESFYAMPQFGAAHPQRTAMVTRLMILPRMRGSRLAIDMSAACYRLGLEHDIDYNFIDCNAHLVRFFKSLGYRDYQGKRVHEEYGEVTPLVFHLHDKDHLEKIKSPLLPVIAGWPGSKDLSLGRALTHVMTQKNGEADA